MLILCASITIFWYFDKTQKQRLITYYAIFPTFLFYGYDNFIHLFNMKKYILPLIMTICIWSINSEAFAQQGSIATLKNSLKLEKNEILQADILLGISEEYERNDELNEALDFAQQSLMLSEKNDYKKGITFAYLQLSEIHGKLGNKSQQRKFKRKGNNAFEKINTTIGNDLANLNRQQLLAEEQLKKQQQASQEELKKQQQAATQQLNRQQLLANKQQTEQQEKIQQSSQTISQLSADTTQNRVEILSNKEAIAKQNFQIERMNHEKQIQTLAYENQLLIQRFLIIGLGFLVILALLLGRLYHNNQKSNRALSEKNGIIALEKQHSDSLLLNILPQDLVDELKLNGVAKARYYEQVSVLFTDFKDFTSASNYLTPQALVEEIDVCFRAFDHIIDKYPGIEKIKTIGDAYLCAAGLPTPNTTHARDLTKAAIEIRDFMLALKTKRKLENKYCFDVRIGVHTGSVIAGVVGMKKFAYDIWGDTVNTASRMESNSESGKINISNDTYHQIKDHFSCQYRGKIDAKNKGEIDMYFVENQYENKESYPVYSP